MEDLRHSHCDVVDFAAPGSQSNVRCRPVSYHFRSIAIVKLQVSWQHFSCVRGSPAMLVERIHVINVLSKPVGFPSKTVRSLAQTFHESVFELFFEALVIATAEDVICEAITV